MNTCCESKSEKMWVISTASKQQFSFGQWLDQCTEGFFCCLQDQKKLHDLLLTEKEAMYGSKPSPRRSNSFRKTNGFHTNGSVTPSPRRNSAGCQTPELLTPRSYSGRQNGYFRETRRLSTAPLNFVAIAKEDMMSFSSVSGSEPESPLQA